MVLIRKRVPESRAAATASSCFPRSYATSPEAYVFPDLPFASIVRAEVDRAQVNKVCAKRDTCGLVRWFVFYFISGKTKIPLRIANAASQYPNTPLWDGQVTERVGKIR